MIVDLTPDSGIDEVPLPDEVPWCTAAYTGTVMDGRALTLEVVHRGDDWPKAMLMLCANPKGKAQRRLARNAILKIMNDNGIGRDKADDFIARKLKVTLKQVGHAPVSAADEARYNFSDSDFTPADAAPGVASASITALPSWCQGVVLTERWAAGRIGRTVHSGYAKDLVDGARQVCERAATNATWQKEAGYILQMWMNAGHFTQAVAEASLKARVQTQKLAADRAALCKSLDVSPEASGEVLAFSNAHKRFFGCGDDLPVWLDHSGMTSEVEFYIDPAPRPETEMLRMYYLIHFVPSPWSEELPSREASKNDGLVYYAMAQSDFAALDEDALAKQLRAAPYDNDYARLVASETVPYVKSVRAAYEAAVDKLAKSDKDYLHLLREVPKSSAAAWEKLTAPWKPELERSYAFERKLSEPSRAAVKGCAAELGKDASKLLKSYNKHTYHELFDRVAEDPVSRILLGRLAICDGIEHIDGTSGGLAELVKHHEARGPRTAMYDDMAVAIATMRKDRPKLLLPPVSYARAIDTPPSLFRRYEGVLNGVAYDDPEQVYEKGYVKSVKKVTGGLEITFRQDKISFAHYDCTDDVHHPIRVNGATGHMEYSRNCVATGKMDSQDNTPHPVIVAEGGAAGVKPGVLIACGDVQRSDANAYVIYVRTSPKSDKIETFFGLPL